MPKKSGKAGATPTRKGRGHSKAKKRKGDKREKRRQDKRKGSYKSARRPNISFQDDNMNPKLQRRLKHVRQKAVRSELRSKHALPSLWLSSQNQTMITELIRSIRLETVGTDDSTVFIEEEDVIIECRRNRRRRHKHGLFTLEDIAMFGEFWVGAGEREELDAEMAAIEAALLEATLEEEEGNSDSDSSTSPSEENESEEEGGVIEVEDEEEEEEEEEEEPINSEQPNNIPSQAVPAAATVTHSDSTLSYSLSAKAAAQRRADEQSLLLLNRLRQRERGDVDNSLKALLADRQRLPIAAHRDALVAMVTANQVSLVSGATGSGKTTQLPQYILDDAIDKGRGGHVTIIVTQPRRIAAIAAAERVAAERGVTVGSEVGYQIRLEAVRSEQTRILFVTTGVLLRRLLLGDPNLEGITHLVMDEVHERNVESDFLATVVKDLLPRRPDLKLVLMSATLNSELFTRYYGNCPTIDIPGRMFPVDAYYLEDIEPLTGIKVSTNRRFTELPPTPGPFRPTTDEHIVFRKKGGKKGRPQPPSNGGSEEALTKKRNKKGARQGANAVEGIHDDDTPPSPVRPTEGDTEFGDEEDIDYELIERLVLWISHNFSERPHEGAILIFLTGLPEITLLWERFQTHRILGNPARFLILPVHSSLPTAQQHAIFDPPLPGQRKIVIATNIAETSITIDDVAFVIDPGKVKENSWSPSSGMASLTTRWVSRAAIAQRRGRAGRTKKGMCFHLFTRARESQLREFPLAEMHRVPLDSLALQVRLLGLGRVEQFLEKAVEPPSREAIRRSVEMLREIGAFAPYPSEDLTPLGYHLARLPVVPRLAKVMILGAILHCVAPVLTIAAALSAGRSPFVAPLEKRDAADAAKRRFAAVAAGGRYGNAGPSDLLALLAAYEGWQQARRAGPAVEKEYCWKNFLSIATMRTIRDLKKQYYELLWDAGFIRPKQKANESAAASGPTEDINNRNSDNYAVVAAVIVAGLYPSVAKVEPKVTKKGAAISLKLRDGTAAAVHPSSVMKRWGAVDAKWVVFHELVRTTKPYLRDATIASPYALLLFGGNIAVKHQRKIITVDKWIAFRAPSRVGRLVAALRAEVDRLLLWKIEHPSDDLSETGKGVIETIVALLSANSS